MIESGMDGWSRGIHDRGVSLGKDLCLLVPLHLGAFRRGGESLLSWLESWMVGRGGPWGPERKLRPLETVEWFDEGHRAGVHLWAPPPAAALIALKEIARSRQKQPHWVRHVFVCQRLLWQEEWRRRFEKEMDFWCFVWPGAEVWRPSNFEPLLLGISFPMCRGTRPWLVRERGDAMVEAGRSLSKVSRSCNL